MASRKPLVVNAAGIVGEIATGDTLPAAVLPSSLTAACTATQFTNTFLDVSVTGGSVAGGSFVWIPCTTVNTDKQGNYNTSTGYYTVPTTGTYMIVSKFRLADGTFSGGSYGQGVNNSNVDGAWFSWFTGSSATPYERNGSINTRIVRFTSGTTIGLYVYCDGSGSYSISFAGLNIAMLAAG